MTIHGVPHHQIDTLQAYFTPKRELRNVRNQKMVERINQLLVPLEITLDFTRDVVPLSMYHDGGSITERHLMLAVARALLSHSNPNLPALLKQLDIVLSPKQCDLLTNPTNPFLEYDLLGVLKGAFVPKCFVPAVDECPTLEEIVDISRKVGGVLCYAYLGDVSDSVTGDKKAQKFEDAYLEELMDTLHSCGVFAVTYMPTRNTPDQLARLRALCQQFHMLQISGEDINSPRQSFVIHAMERPEFANLIDSTWALIAHEQGKKKLY